MTMFFTEKPATNWIKLFTTKRDKLRTTKTIPRIEAEWKYADHPKLEAYQDCFGFPHSHIPLSYPQILATPLYIQLFTDARFPFPILGIVHTHQKMRLHYPMTKQSFDIKSWVEGHRIVRAGAEFIVHTEVYQESKLVWDSEMIILSKAIKGHGKKEVKKETFLPHPEQVESWHFPSHLGVQYAKVSGDYNPIHLYPLTAKMFGMPRHIIQGMYSIGKILSALPETISEMNISFRRPIFLPASVDFLSSEGEFLLRNPKNGKTHLSGDYQITASG